MLLLGNELLLIHLEQHPVHTGLGLIRVGDRVVGAGGVGQARHECGLRDGQLGGGVGEVVLGGGLNPVGRRAEGGNVEVALEDLLLGVGLLHGQGVLDFAQLAGDGLLPGGGDLCRVP